MKEFDDLAATLNRIFLALLCAVFVLGFLLGLSVGSDAVHWWAGGL
jgi:hypothetical protein